MSRRFELLKDLPDAKAGTIFTSDGTGYYDYKTSDIKLPAWYNRDYVENNPEWFREIKDTEESSKPFVWTDELVMEFFNMAEEKFRNNNGVLWLSMVLDNFKKEQSYSAKAGAGTANDVLNSECKDWEIVEGKTVNGTIHKWGKTCNEIPPCEIYSVKRLSDSEVFSVGDTVMWSLPEHRGINAFDITSFQINKMLPTERMFCNNQNIDICYLTKFEPQQESKRIEVESLQSFISNPKNGERTHYFDLSNGKYEMDEDKRQLIKSAIEKILNNE